MRLTKITGIGTTSSLVPRLLGASVLAANEFGSLLLVRRDSRLQRPPLGAIDFGVGAMYLIGRGFRGGRLAQRDEPQGAGKSARAKDKSALPQEVAYCALTRNELAQLPDVAGIEATPRLPRELQMCSVRRRHV